MATPTPWGTRHRRSRRRRKRGTAKMDRRWKLMGRSNLGGGADPGDRDGRAGARGGGAARALEDELWG